jgi:signal transduction histidine kinase
MPYADPDIIQNSSRLRVLHRLNLLDTPSEAAFDRLTQLASKILNAPVTLVSLVDADRQFFKSFVGLPEPYASARETPLSHSFCQHVVATNQPLVITDAREHPLVLDNLAIPDLNVIAYVGVPVTLEDGSTLGSFCAIDSKPRVWSDEEIEIVKELAASVMVEIELRGQLLARQEAEISLVQANRALAVARKQAEAANHFKNQFLATMSHELRTPLNAIIGYTQLQVAGMIGPLNDEQKGFQERVLVNAQHLLQLINDILDISKIEAGRMELAEQPFNLRQTLESIVSQSRVLAESKGLAFTLEYAPDLPEQVIGDQTRLRQVVLNLVSNAVKFTDAGSIRVTADPYQQGQWRLTVTDTGVGIPSHQQETIFDEFRQASEGLQRGGTGLGLAIVRKLVLMMSGTIRVFSQMGNGSIFTVTLPLVEAIPSDPKEPVNAARIQDGFTIVSSPL